MISCRENIIIGNNCIFGNNVSIYDNDHDYKNSLEKYVTNKVEIGDNTWCGCNVVILKGVTIGKNCVIAAGTLVNKDVPDNSIVYNSKELIIKKK
jgi:acetyltransferase-like isoleucine patch superfamily enzyme